MLRLCRQSSAVLSRHFSSTPSTGGFKVTRQVVANEAVEVFKLMFGTLTLFLGGSMAIGYSVENYKRMHPPTPPGRIMDIEVDGHKSKVHTQVYTAPGSEHHKVTVLLDGSLGETSFDWEKVATNVSEKAVVVTIDRPGLGFSTPGLNPRSSKRISGEYQAVLEQLGISGPVILVGHGIGGYHMRQLAADLEATPSTNVRCVGLVLVDAMHESVKANMDQIAPSIQDALAARQRNASTLLKMSHFGLVRLVHSIQSKRQQDRFLATSQPYVDYYTPSPLHRRGVVSETEALNDIESSFLTSPLPILSQPLVVLSHGNSTMFAAMKMEPGIDNSMIDRMEEEWGRGQEALAKLSTNTVRRIVSDVGHDIAHEKPDEVTKSILAVLQESNGHANDGLASLA